MAAGGGNAQSDRSRSLISRMRDTTWPSSLYRDPTQFWALVILGTAVYGIVPLGTSGRAINLSLFDLIVVLLFVVTVRDRAVQVDRVVLTIALAAMALVIVHSAAFLLAGAPHDLAGLARETAKSTAFFLEVLLLTIVMRAGGIRLPSLRILTLLFVILSIQAVALHFQELYAPGSWFLPRNQHMATLAGLIVLAALAYAGGAITRRYLVIGIAALIAVAFLLFSKTYGHL